MTRSSYRLRPVVVLTLLTLLFSAVAVPTVGGAPPKAERTIGSADRTVMFASDGMRPDFVEKFAAEGVMPTYQALMDAGATGDNGMVQAFPPNTGVGWYTMATGTYPSEHGSTNNTFFRAGDAFNNRTSFSGAGVLQADTIANAAERAGKKVAQIDWVAGVGRQHPGPDRRLHQLLLEPWRPGRRSRPRRAGRLGLLRRRLRGCQPRRTASGWSGRAGWRSRRPPKQTTWSSRHGLCERRHGHSDSPARPDRCTEPDRTYNVYLYDSVVGGGVVYDHAIVSPVGKTGASPSVDLAVGDFEPIKLTGAMASSAPRAGQTAGHYVKLISISPDASQFKLYITSLSRAIARCGTPCSGLPAGGAGEDRLEKYIADNLLPWAAGDFAPLEAGVIDEDTYVEQGRDLERAYSHQVIEYILGELQPDTDLAMVGYPFTDEVQHQFLALVVPDGRRRRPEPVLRRHPEVRRRPSAPEPVRPGSSTRARSTSAAPTWTRTRSSGSRAN